MKPRVAGLGVAAILGAMLLVLGLSAFGIGDALENGPRRIAFQIATGSTGGTYFPVGELIAGIISHPPGVGRCEVDGACGPEGLIASARTSDGAVANALAVNSGQMDSGLAQSDVVADAWSGEGAFRKAGKQTHLRVIAALFPEDVLIVVSPSAHIASVADLRGKRVSLGTENSGTIVTARAVLAAYRMSERDLKVHHLSPDLAAQMLSQKKLDAFFFVGGAPVPLVQALTAANSAKLIAIDGDARARLLKAEPSLSATTIAANIYSNAKPLETVHGRALFIVHDSTPDALVYGIARALFAPVNTDMLAGGDRSAALIRLDIAAKNLPAPLHPGAARFFRERGVLR
jgi:TRAP transporter TAXI family solute receptor